MRLQKRGDDPLVDERGALRLRRDEPEEQHGLELEVQGDPADEEERGLDEREEGVDDPVGEPLVVVLGWWSGGWGGGERVEGFGK